MDDKRNENAPKLQSLKTVIRTKDFLASKKFYHKILNLNIVEEYDDGDGSKGCILGFTKDSNNAFIEISEIKPSHSYYQEAFSKALDHDKIDIQIKTDSIDYWAERLRPVCEIRGPVKRPWGAYYLYLRDPDGLQLSSYPLRPGSWLTSPPNPSPLGKRCQ